jgi:hypothetical protein
MTERCNINAATECPTCADLRAMGMSDAISFVWAAESLPGHLKCNMNYNLHKTDSG